jgi:murein DD-endopeptidase MepM/ murein hydrolase activator NlpD
MYPVPQRRIDGISVVAIAMVIFIGLSLLLGKGQGSNEAEANDGGSADQVPASTSGMGPATPVPTPPVPVWTVPGDQTLLVPPYVEYIVTQGPHGFAYGHSAVDISGGKGASLLSPVNGAVTQRYTDEYGNTTLVIENDKYQLTFLHGDYLVNAGDKLYIGQIIGVESNHGYTTYMQGRSCRGRDCGYHSHLNVFDKEMGANINPLYLWK